VVIALALHGSGAIHTTSQTRCRFPRLLARRPRPTHPPAPRNRPNGAQTGSPGSNDARQNRALEYAGDFGESAKRQGGVPFRPELEPGKRS
jgi:hypothetical protein